MSLLRNIYAGIFRRTSTYTLAVVALVFAFERAIDQGTDLTFSMINKGKLYDDVIRKYQRIKEEQE